MPGYRRTTRLLSKAQKAAQAKREIAQSSRMILGLMRPQRQTTHQQLQDYLINYNARMIEIDIKYPLGHPERPEWLEVHQKQGVKRILQIVADKTDGA
jgi:hypothetical protein